MIFVLDTSEIVRSYETYEGKSFIFSDGFQTPLNEWAEEKFKCLYEEYIRKVKPIDIEYRHGKYYIEDEEELDYYIKNSKDNLIELSNYMIDKRLEIFKWFLGRYSEEGFTVIFVNKIKTEYNY